MKNYTITVNGKVYDVTVEEGSNGSQSTASSQAVKPVPVEKKVEKPAAGSKEGSVKVTAPMPGKILSIKAQIGQKVSKGDVIVMMEAMKMETEVVAPQDGVVADFRVSGGESVEMGDVVATLN